MSDLILHQYDVSTFSEKVRLLLGFKQAAYRMVEIPVIMPRPYVIPLTGGYRKTPVMQIGADIFCDTALICRVIDEMYPEKTIYPETTLAADTALANWIDTFLFRCAVAVTFQPKALAGNSLLKDEATAAAFMADRAELSKGSTQLQMDLSIAESHYLAFLNDFDRQLATGTGFFGGAAPSIVDFSTFHLVWFVRGREQLHELFSPFDNVMAWFKRMQEFGHGSFEMISGQEAIDAAVDAEPEGIGEATFLENLPAGAKVNVMPIDYGFQPVTGELLSADFEQISIVRTDEQVGRVVVHFPRMGFQITAAE